jgi:hypothetical protein
VANYINDLLNLRLRVADLWLGSRRRNGQPGHRRELHSHVIIFVPEIARREELAAWSADKPRKNSQHENREDHPAREKPIPGPYWNQSGLLLIPSLALSLFE